MTKILLKQPKAVARIVELYGVYSKGTAQPVRADTSNLAGLGAKQLAQPGPTGTLSNY